MSRNKNVYQPNLAGSIYGGERTNNVTSLQVHGTTNPSVGNMSASVYTWRQSVIALWCL
jgi:hypothetical protein